MGCFCPQLSGAFFSARQLFLIGSRLLLEAWCKAMNTSSGVSMQACSWWKTFGYLLKRWPEYWAGWRVLGQSPEVLLWLLLSWSRSAYLVSSHPLLTFLWWTDSGGVIGSKLELSGAEIVQIASTSAHLIYFFFLMWNNIAVLATVLHLFGRTSKLRQVYISHSSFCILWLAFCLFDFFKCRIFAWKWCRLSWSLLVLSIEKYVQLIYSPGLFSLW